MAFKVLKEFRLVQDGINGVIAKVDEEIEVAEHLVEGLISEGFIKAIGRKANDAKATTAPENKAVETAPQNKASASPAMVQAEGPAPAKK